MKGRCAIRRCCKLGLTQSQKKTRKQKTKVSGLLSLPDDVALTCLARVSRVDLAPLAVASKAHRSLVVSPELWNLRNEIGIEPSLYVCLQIFPEPTPRWFVHHPVQRRLKPIYPDGYVSSDSSASYVAVDWGLYIIGGLVNGKPTRDVFFLDCYDNHQWYRCPSMKMPRASASASFIDGKIYVFGGCGDDVADSSNWAEVFDLETDSWDFMFVFTPKMPFNIKQSVVERRETNVYYGWMRMVKASPSHRANDLYLCQAERQSLTIEF